MLVALVDMSVLLLSIAVSLVAIFAALVDISVSFDAILVALAAMSASLVAILVALVVIFPVLADISAVLVFIAVCSVLPSISSVFSKAVVVMPFDPVIVKTSLSRSTSPVPLLPLKSKSCAVIYSST